MTKEVMTPMQQELLNRADEIFKSISSAASTAVEFGKEQIPDIAYQYILFNRAYLTFIVLASIVVFVGWQVFIIKLNNKQCLKNSYDTGTWNENQGFPYVLSTLALAVPCAIGFFNNIKPLFLVWFAPKIFIIENLVRLVKQ